MRQTDEQTLANLAAEAATTYFGNNHHGGESADVAGVVASRIAQYQSSPLAITAFTDYAGMANDLADIGDTAELLQVAGRLLDKRAWDGVVSFTCEDGKQYIAFDAVVIEEASVPA